MLDGMRSSSRRRPAPRFAAAMLAGALVLVAAGCDDGSDSSSRSRDRDRDRTTTTTAAPSTSSSTGPTTTSSTVPPLTPAPANSCGQQAEFIVQAAEESDDPALAGATGQFTAGNCRLSQSELIWAVVDLTPKPGSSFAATTALMERIGATWIVRQIGSLETCDAPERARAELGLACSE
jgi:hypothetical protein